MNGWNWRPTVACLERTDAVPSGVRVERCFGNGCGGYLSFKEAFRAANFLDELLVTLNASQRILHDGSIANKPIDFQKPICELAADDWHNHYSAKYEVLTAFAKFFRTGGGFRVH